MPHVVIAGGGFAALWTAAAAARRRHEAHVPAEELRITMVSPDPCLVMRPRLYEAAPNTMVVPVDRFVQPIGVHHVRAAVAGVDADDRRVTLEGAGDEVPTQLAYDRLVVATGSRLATRGRPKTTAPLHDVDTLPAATALERHLEEQAWRPPAPGRFTVVVVGAGFVGVELATELVDRVRAIAQGVDAADEVEVILLERAAVVAPELGEAPRPTIVRALEQLGIEVRLHSSLANFDGVQAWLADGRAIPAQTVVWTAGMRASALTEQLRAARDDLGRLEVDQHFRVKGVDGVYAAGDVAAVEVAPGRYAVQACQYAHQMGKHAGRNVVSDLLGLPLLPFTPDPYVTCLDLGAAGALYTEGYDRAVVASGVDAKSIKHMVNRELIYPPLDDADQILLAADTRAPVRAE